MVKKDIKMKKYLYGASVQGIQRFIFQTNKLAEIVGASELVESICTDKFYEVAGIQSNDPKILMAAAGNIKYFFDDETKCRDFVKMFPKIVMDMAPGITISQAVVAFEGDYPKHTDIDCLEIKLKAQRNKVSIPTEIGFMALERARRTGGVAFEEVKDRKGKPQIVDEATYKKLDRVKFKKDNDEEKANEKLFYTFSGLEEVRNKDISFDISDITKSGKNSWIAVIHADGNGLGNILQNYGRKITENKEFKLFSDLIQKSTEKACQIAFKKLEKGEKYKFPIRPVVIGGDDVTIIIRADLALDFTIDFLKAFEQATKSNFKDLKTTDLHFGLTACAGIAFVKESYPLHYALKLAEDLCKDAKKMVKSKELCKDGEMPKSSLAFFRVQDSFVENLEDMKERTLKTGNGIDYDYGPYLIHKESNFHNIEDLNHKLEILKTEANKNEKSKAVSKLRQLISASFKDKSTMQIMKDRMKSVNDQFYNNLELDNELQGKSMLYDLIQLHSFKY
jgi:hypothetical protein